MLVFDHGLDQPHIRGMIGDSDEFTASSIRFILRVPPTSPCALFMAQNWRNTHLAHVRFGIYEIKDALVMHFSTPGTDFIEVELDGFVRRLSDEEISDP